ASGAPAAVAPRARQASCTAGVGSMACRLPAGQVLPARPLARAVAMLPPPMKAIESWVSIGRDCSCHGTDLAQARCKYVGRYCGRAGDPGAPGLYLGCTQATLRVGCPGTTRVAPETWPVATRYGVRHASPFL